MNHINVNDDYRKRLLENSDWAKIGLTMSDESGVTALDEAAEVVAEEEVVEEDIETDHQCPVCQHEISEDVDPSLFLEHLEKVTGLMEAVQYINENYDADEDSALLGALAYVFPDQFEDLELVEEEAEEEE